MSKSMRHEPDKVLKRPGRPRPKARHIAPEDRMPKGQALRIWDYDEPEGEQTSLYEERGDDE